MEKIVSLCKRRGFIFQSSEIYGGINGFWDYGPLGAELKRNVKELWWNDHDPPARRRRRPRSHHHHVAANLEGQRPRGHVQRSDVRLQRLTKNDFALIKSNQHSGVAYHFKGAEDPLALADIMDLLEGFEPESELQKELASEKNAHEVASRLSKSVNPKLREAGERVLKELSKRARGVCEDKFSVLLQAGKPPESAYKAAIQFYERRGLSHPQPILDCTEKVENSIRFCNPKMVSLNLLNRARST